MLRIARKSAAGTEVWRFDDRHEHPWDVIVGRESWGTLVALFLPIGRAEPVRQTVLQATSHEQAVAELDRLDRIGWQQLLDASVPKDD